MSDSVDYERGYADGYFDGSGGEEAETIPMSEEEPYERECSDGSGIRVWSCCGMQTNEGHTDACQFATP